MRIKANPVAHIRADKYDERQSPVLESQPLSTRLKSTDAATPKLPQSIVYTPLSRLKPARRNVRNHSKKQIQQIANSIGQFGWTYPILIDETGVIIAGHGRFQAAELLGLKQVPVLIISGC
jgi:hypothetical protein